MVSSVDYFEAITDSEFQEIFKLAGEEFNKEEVRELKNPIENILFLCKIYDKIIRQYLTTKNKPNELAKKNKDDFLSIQLYGARLLYSIRSFLLKEDIEFLLGDKPPDGELVEKVVPQTYMLKNLRGSLSQEALLLNHQIKELNTFKLTNASIASMWADILQYGIFDYDDSWKKTKGHYKMIQKRSSSGKRPIYQHKEKDTDAYIGFAGRQKIFYYGDKNLFYNQGWLFEWFRSMTYEADNVTMTFLENLLEGHDHPLFFIINNLDNVQGLQGGDFVSNLGQQVQAKYMNQQIISFYNIRKSLSEVIEILTTFINGIKGQADKEELSKNIAKVFSSEETRINKSYTEVLNQILESLQVKN